MDEDWIRSLIAEGEPEGQRLDFKRQAPSSDEKGLKGFLIDICALANAQGGVVLYGVEQTSDGRAKSIVGLTDNIDELAIRLQTKAANHIFPRITGLILQPIHTEQGAVLAVVVPEQFEAPFEVSLADWRRFPVRTGTKNSDMDYRQLSNAFLGRQSVVERLSDWRKLRCDSVSARAADRSERIAFLQIVPMSAFGSNTRPDLSRLRGDPMRWSGNVMNSRYNVHGLVMVLGQPQIHPAFDFVQWHRNGSVDMAWQITRTASSERRLQTKKSVERMHDLLPQIADHLRMSGLSGAAVISVSLLNIDQHRLFFNDQDGYPTESPQIEVSNLTLEPEFIEDLQELKSNSLALITKIMDQMFQSFGEDSCPHFSRAGMIR